LSRSDAVICCGGLGPTQDDLTRRAIATVMGVALVSDEAMEEHIIGLFSGRGRSMPANNLRQAELPEGASFIEQMPGTAPGLVCPLSRTAADGTNRDLVVYAVPGVPWEMREMIAGTVLPDLQRRAGITAAIRSRTLRTWGESESRLAELLAGRIDELDRTGGATLAFLASGIEGLKVRITAKAPTAEEADALLADEEAQVRALLGPLVFGVDDDTMESVTLDLLKERGLTLAVAESLTGGMVGSRICDVPGAGDVFVGGVVSYASRIKFDVLGVPEGPVVTTDAAVAMAHGVRRALGADVGLAATGVAGPEEQEGRPAGTVCLAVVVGEPGSGDRIGGGGPDEGPPPHVESVELRLPGGRRQVREFSVITLLGLLRRYLADLDDPAGHPD
jgi:nicotinamide-nucleotide amidase